MTELRKLTIGDGPNLDAFSRLRVSQPVTLFDAQFTYGTLQPLLYEQITNGSGATVTADTTNRDATLAFSSTATGGIARMQTFEHFRYQPGKSQLVLITFNMRGGTTNVVKAAGYSDGTNGVEFILDGTAPKVRILSGTTTGNQTVAQADWNLDPMNGNGPSGINLNFEKIQILVIDLQALYVGRVRIGWDVGGQIVYCHEFSHANDKTEPYLQTANLPVRVGMTCTGTVTTTMDFVCCSVISEGGQDDATGYLFSAAASLTAGNNTRTHALSLRPRTTFQTFANRARFVLESVDVMVTGNTPVQWELCLGQTLTTPSYANVNATYSTMDVDTAGTVSGSPTIVVQQGFVSASNQAKSTATTRVPMRYPITLDAAGAVRALGTLSLVVTGLGATSACRAALNWREIR